MSTRWLIRFTRHQDGSSLVEIAVIVPILLLLLLGTLDVGLLLSQYLRVVDSARSAAEANTNRFFNSNTGLAQLVGTSSASDIPGYRITVTNYCTCAPGSAQFSCGTGSSNYQYCSSYGLPNMYSKATATATLPVLFTSTSASSFIPFLPRSIPVRFVAISRISWVGSGS